MLSGLRNTLRHVLRPATLLPWFMFTLAATVTGPFNTLALLDDLPRAVYWAGIVGGALVLSHLLSQAIFLWIPDRSSRLFDLARVGAMVVVFSPLAYGWTRFMIPASMAHSPSLAKIGLFVALIGTVVHISKRIVRGQDPFVRQTDGALNLGFPEPGTPEVEAAPEPRLMRRLPEGATGPVLRLSASDHFVEVVLPEATHSLRMRFTDAIDEMDGIEGYCSHRSHWVTRAAIAGVERDGAKISLRLVNGDEIPVSRTYKPRLEDAGIL